jgi:hypothetical protein
MRQALDPRLKRIKKGPMRSDDSYGFNGAFEVTGPKGKLHLIVSDPEGWEHASVSPAKNDRTPTWEEMAFIKGLLWGDEEAVIQYHPPKSRYVNNHPHVLHLWKPIGIEIPLPPVYMVGIPGVRVHNVIQTRGGRLVIAQDEK